MTLTELHAAVMASEGPLNDSMVGEMWCLVHGLNHKYSYSYAEYYPYQLMVCSGPDDERGTEQWILHPGLIVDAALALVRVRWPRAEYDLLSRVFGQRTYRFVLSLPKCSPIADHSDPRLAILAALLKSMETATCA
jgi:hypothetical protein